MMQATKSRKRCDLGTGSWYRRRTLARSLLLQSQVRAIIVVVRDILSEQATAMPFVEHDDMVEQVTPTTSDPALRDPVLPGASEGGADRNAAHSLNGGGDLWVKFRVAVEDQMPRQRVVGKGVAKLLGNPGACRMTGDVEVQNAATVVCNDEEAVKNSERQGRNREEIHRGNDFAMIAEKSLPTLCRFWISRCKPHPDRKSVV